jgi:hypothetical protein
MKISTLAALLHSFLLTFVVFYSQINPLYVKSNWRGVGIQASARKKLANRIYLPPDGKPLISRAHKRRPGSVSLARRSPRLPLALLP